MTIGERIKTERERCGWSKVELSQKSGISDRSISHYENEERDPQLGTLKSIFGAMGIEIQFIRTGDQNNVN